MPPITPPIVKRPSLPEVRIARCCEGAYRGLNPNKEDRYVNARINGVWHNVFTFPDETNSKIVHAQSRAADKCMICGKALAEAATRVYHFGEDPALDDNFTRRAADLTEALAQMPRAPVPFPPPPRPEESDGTKPVNQAP